MEAGYKEYVPYFIPVLNTGIFTCRNIVNESEDVRKREKYSNRGNYNFLEINFMWRKSVASILKSATGENVI